MNKIRATDEVRKLLVELDGHFEKLNALNTILSDQNVDYALATSAGHEKKLMEGIIIGCAFNINKASKKKKGE
ncbi:MAG: hypothetical protein E3K37_01485 [Candidatus Kuenenia sp.]|nr:hypothetical protein [Candidatus Kuenenia hertensis]